MHFTEFRLIHFGLYPGEHVIDVRPLPADEDHNRPIILIGGKNGAGKTTILEAVRLCLYGSSSLGKGTKRSAYEAYLLSRIHRQLGAPLQHTFAGVVVGFVHTIGTTTHEFTIRRMWTRRNKGVQETLTVLRDGVQISEQELAMWEQFLYDLIPLGLADLFFFDGEKIQALADDPDYVLLGESIRSLLGLDLLNRLRTDLSIYLARQRKTGGDKLDDLLQDLHERRSHIEEGFRQAFLELSHTNSSLAHIQGKIEATERHLASEGGEIVAQRDALKQRATILSEAIHRHERGITEQANMLLPFAIIPELSYRLKIQLEHEEQVEQYIQVSTIANQFIEQLVQQFEEDKDWLEDLALSKKKRNKLLQSLAQKGNTVRDDIVHKNGTDLETERMIHPVEKNARREMISWLDQAIQTVPPQLAELGAALEQAKNELLEIEALLMNAPAEEIIQPIIQQLSTLQRELGMLEAQRKTQEAKVQGFRQQRESLDKEQKDLYTRLMRGDDPDYRLQLASRAQQVLVRYEEVLRQSKISELEKAIVDCFSKLSRKGHFIHRIAIHPENFSTTLYNRKGDALPSEQLSAGEKQIYAIAVLWALRLVSGRSLPIIVDTPFGRLDSEHRQHLIQRYFPHASHQVILLSTDTEIDATLYADIAPAVTRSYQLEYQNDAASTHITQGYFWSESEVSVKARKAEAS